jgi:hypothetical protein
MKVGYAKVFIESPSSMVVGEIWMNTSVSLWAR